MYVYRYYYISTIFISYYVMLYFYYICYIYIVLITCMRARARACVCVCVFLITSSLIHTNVSILFETSLYISITYILFEQCMCVYLKRTCYVCICYFCALYSTISCTYYTYISLYIRYNFGDVVILNMKFSFSYLNIICKPRDVK